MTRTATARPTAPVEGARRAATPPFVQPELATLVTDVPDAAGWVHELKLDGYRLLCRRDGDEVRLITRSGNDWTERFRELLAPLRKLRATSYMLDAEAVVLDARGRSSFQALQRALGGAPGGPGVRGEG